MPPLRVIVATPSPLAQSRLARDLAALPEVELCGKASDLSGIYMLAEREEPQIALVAGDLMRHADFEGILSLFRVIGTAAIEILAEPPAAPAATGGPKGVAPGMPPQALLAALRAAREPGTAPTVSAQIAVPQPAGRFRSDRVILIGASTGGIDALLQILAAFPADCPPTAIVQHTGAAFSDSLIRLFARCAQAQVLPAQAGQPFRPGTITVGAGCRGHLQLRPGAQITTEVVAGQPVSGHMPSVDQLFRSALPIAPHVVAALLTGMGRDGAQGLLDLRRAGAQTIAQDEASSVVYGMPRAAAELGAAAQIVPLPRIAAEILSHCAEKRMEAARR